MLWTRTSLFCIIKPFLNEYEFHIDPSQPSPAQPSHKAICEWLNTHRRRQHSKLTLRCSTFASRNRRIAVFGDRTFFCLRAVDFPTEIDRRFFDAESIDFDASIDRGARKLSNATIAFSYRVLHRNFQHPWRIISRHSFRCFSLFSLYFYVNCVINVDRFFAFFDSFKSD